LKLWRFALKYPEVAKQRAVESRRRERLRSNGSNEVGKTDGGPLLSAAKR
jgi:hypothetical protein